MGQQWDRLGQGGTAVGQDGTKWDKMGQGGTGWDRIGGESKLGVKYPGFGGKGKGGRVSVLARLWYCV